MDPRADMADQQAVSDDAPLLGPSARAFGKAALVAYWIACLSVITLGLSQMEWRWPLPNPPDAVAAAPAARPLVERAPVGKGPAPATWWAGAVALLSTGGLVVLGLRSRRRRGSRQSGRFSGRGRRLGSLR